MSSPEPTTAVEVLVAYASRHGATRGIAQRIGVRLHDAGLEAELRGHAFAGRLGDNRDWDEIDAWADGIATSLTTGPIVTKAC